jgi:hypothetical protein
VNVLGHQDIGCDDEALLSARLFQEPLDGVFGLGSAQEGLPLVATEGDEVEELGLLKAFEAGRHGGARSLHPVLTVGAGEESRGPPFTNLKISGGLSTILGCPILRAFAKGGM